MGGVNTCLTPGFLDESLEYLGPNELLEVTPHSLRIRKKELRHEVRMRAKKQA
jgi:GTP-binding protein